MLPIPVLVSLSFPHYISLPSTFLFRYSFITYHVSLITDYLDMLGQAIYGHIASKDIITASKDIITIENILIILE